VTDAPRRDARTTTSAEVVPRYGLSVRDARGDLVFESGKLLPDGSIGFCREVSTKPQRFSVSVELLFQSIGYRWAQNLKPYEAAETRRFVAYYEQSAADSAVRLAFDTATADGHMSAGRSASDSAWSTNYQAIKYRYTLTAPGHLHAATALTQCSVVFDHKNAHDFEPFLRRRLWNPRLLRVRRCVFVPPQAFPLIAATASATTPAVVIAKRVS
jgi:hypothetical protein